VKLSDESSESESDDVATITIKGKASSSKSLFPNLPKHTCLMAKESKKKVKSAFSCSKYVSSDEDTLVITMLLVMMITLFQVNL
jgi:hypothetical protein